MAAIRQYALCFLLVLLLATTAEANQSCRNETNPATKMVTMICSRSDNLTQYPAYLPNTEVFILAGSKEEPYKLNWDKAFKNLPASLKEIRISHTNMIGIATWMFNGSNSLSKLDLSHNQISDIDQKALQNLIGLSYLNLTGNRISKLPSYQFQNLTRLEYLDLSYNQLSSISQKVLGGLNSLRELRLDGNTLRALENNSIHLPMEHLTVLNVSNSGLSQWEPEFFSKLPRLKVLDLSHNNLLSVNESYFTNLTALQRLYLNSNHMRSVEADTFRNLNLAELDISDNNLVTIPPTAFKNLRCETLRMNRIRRLNIADLRRALLDVRSVENLDMSSMSLEDKDLESDPFQGLEHCLVRLNVSNNLLTKVPKLPEFAKIKELDFSNNKITMISKGSDFDIAAFAPKLASRQAYLYLQGNRFACNFRCDIELLKEFENLNYKCKEVSDYYCLRCGQDGELRDWKIMDVAESANTTVEDCGPTISRVRAQLSKGNFVYLLMIIILTVVLCIFLVLLFVFRKKVFRSIYHTGEYNANGAASRFSWLLKREADLTNGSATDPSATKLIDQEKAPFTNGNSGKQDQNQEIIMRPLNLPQEQTTHADPKSAADATKSEPSKNGVAHFEKLSTKEAQQSEAFFV